ncbi:MAG: hypothetical protein P8Y04_03430, partial [Desulfobulbaceae bacterium]
FFLIITLLILLCFVITVNIAGAREVYIILKNDSQKLRYTLDILSHCCLIVLKTIKTAYSQGIESQAV